MLDLSGNEIVNMEENSFAGVPNLEKLIIEFNKIRFIHSGIFNNLNKLQQLDLTNNKITFVGKNTFEGMSQLSVLYLDIYLFKNKTIYLKIMLKAIQQQQKQKETSIF